MTETPGRQRRPGAGRKPTPPATHKQRRTITLSPEAWAYLDTLAAGVDHRRNVSAAVECVVRASHWFDGWQAKQEKEHQP
jgi:hypothetical protein